MGLTYTKTESRVVIEKQTVTMTVPKNWGMYTSAGNNAIRKKAQAFYDKAEKLAEQKRNGERVRFVLEDATKDFLEKIWKMSRYKSYQEIMDTMVREAIFIFCDEIWKAVGFNEVPDSIVDQY